MIPEFPEFKQLAFSDKEEIETFIHGLPVYSDFDFASLWSWNVKDDMKVSQLHHNLVLRFTDYLTGEPFYTLIGSSAKNETIQQIMAYSEEQGCAAVLHLVPEEVLQDLDPEQFDITESRDHFDYILSLERYLDFSGGKLKSRRNFFNSFKKHYPDYQTVMLDLTDPETQTRVTDLYRNWQNQKGFLSLSEAFAYDRFLHAAKDLEHIAIGLVVEGKLIAFHVSALPPGDHANGLFEKADIAYPGVYQALMHEVAKVLIAKGKHYLNYEQDLGIESLRQAKMAFDPSGFQKKYSVSRKGAFNHSAELDGNPQSSTESASTA